MKANGISRRNSQRVFLFLHGYGYSVSSVREPLRLEYVSFGRALLAPVRSRHLATKDKIPEGQEARLIRTFGEADPTFIEAGLRLPKESLVTLIRAATQDFVEVGSLPGNEPTKLADIESRSSLAILSKVVAGLLMFDENFGIADEATDSVEGLILNAPNEAYVSARHAWRNLSFDVQALNRVLFPEGSQEGTAQAAAEARFAIRHDPRFALSTFILLLRFMTEAIEQEKPR